MANERDSVSAIFASNVVVTVLYVISLSFDRWELLAWVADSLSAVLYTRACSQRLAIPQRFPWESVPVKPFERARSQRLAIPRRFPEESVPRHYVLLI